MFTRKFNHFNLTTCKYDHFNIDLLAGVWGWEPNCKRELPETLNNI